MAQKSLKQPQQSHAYPSQALSRKRITGGINGGLINDTTLKSLEFKRDYLFPFSLLLHNTRPVGRQVLVFSSLYWFDSYPHLILGYSLRFRTPYSFLSLSCSWQTFVSPSLCCFCFTGYLLELFLLYFLSFLYHCFLLFQQD